jgi:hypothetical protein
MSNDCRNQNKSSPEGDTILWIAVGLMFVSLFVVLFA